MIVLSFKWDFLQYNTPYRPCQENFKFWGEMRASGRGDACLRRRPFLYKNLRKPQAVYCASFLRKRRVDKKLHMG